LFSTAVTLDIVDYRIECVHRDKLAIADGRIGSVVW
jgi:hypothetical protein